MKKVSIFLIISTFFLKAETVLEMIPAPGYSTDTMLMDLHGMETISGLVMIMMESYIRLIHMEM